MVLAAAWPTMAAANTGDLAAYLKARAADADGAVDQAATFYASVLRAEPGDDLVALRTYRGALAAGDYGLATRAATLLEKRDKAPVDARLLILANAVKNGDRPVIDATIDRISNGPLDFIGPILRAWAAVDRGDRHALDKLRDAPNNPLAQRYVGENRALLLIATGAYQDGVAAIRAVAGSGQAGLELRIDAAQLLAAEGEKDLAFALLNGDDPVLQAVRAHLGDGVKPDLAFGMSRLFDRLASDLIAGDPTPLPIVLTRCSLRVAPGDDRAKLLLAQALAGDGADDRALAILGEIGGDSPFYGIAQAARVAVLAHAGRDADALAAAKALAEAPGASAADAQLYGDRLMVADRAAEAAQAYTLALDRTGARADWASYLQLGGAFEEAGDWARARPMLQKAVELAPDQPLALNYLGYADIEHGQNIGAAQAMLQKASLLRPDDPSITDSLAWAYAKQGDLAKALPLLEKASQAAPADTDIQDHLGDVLWRTGRYFEARYSWRAAAVNASPKEAARLADKIAHGLPGQPER